MLNFINYQEMAHSIFSNRHALPSQIDLVVGIPRSGIAPAAMLATSLNVPMTDIDGLIEGRLFSSGETKKRVDQSAALSDERTVVVLDDSVNSGLGIQKVKDRVRNAGVKGRIVYAAVYATVSQHPDVDVVFDCRMGELLFPWNFMHHRILGDACVDIDGVLCCNPLEHEDVGGKAYADFLANARPLHTATSRISCLVTSRHEKYRELTEAWLAENDIEYDELVMAKDADVTDSVAYKARVFNSRSESVFIESESDISSMIACQTHKPVICVATMSVATADEPQVSKSFASSSVRPSWRTSQKSHLKLAARRMIGNKTYYMLKDLSMIFRKRQTL